MFYKIENDMLIVIVIKIVNNLMVAGNQPINDQIIKYFNCKFTPGNVLHGPGLMQ